MPRAYDSEFPYEVLLAWSGTSLREAIKSPLFWLAQAMYVVAVVVVRVTGLRALNASKIVGAMKRVVVAEAQNAQLQRRRMEHG